MKNRNTNSDRYWPYGTLNTRILRFMKNALHSNNEPWKIDFVRLLTPTNALAHSFRSFTLQTNTRVPIGYNGVSMLFHCLVFYFSLSCSVFFPSLPFCSSWMTCIHSPISIETVVILSNCCRIMYRWNNHQHQQHRGDEKQRNNITI